MQEMDEDSEGEGARERMKPNRKHKITESLRRRCVVEMKNSAELNIHMHYTSLRSFSHSEMRAGSSLSSQ